MKKLILLMYMPLLFYPFLSLAANYYVDINSIGGPCSDSYSKAENDITRPWCTIQRAVSGSTNYSYNPSNAITAGDTLYIRQGTYYLLGRGRRHEPALNPANSGSNGNYITIRNYPNETVIITHHPSVITPNSPISGPLIGVTEKNYIRFEGLTVIETYGGYTSDTGVCVIWGGNNIIIDRCTLIAANLSNYSGLDNHNVIRTENGVTNLTISNSIIKDCHDGNFQRQNTFAIGLGAIDQADIYNNEISNSSTAIRTKFKYTTNVRIYRNIIRDCGQGITLSSNVDGNKSVYVYQNIFYNINGPAIVPHINNEYTYDFRVYNNTFYNVLTYVIGWGSDTGNNFSFRWYNNILHTFDSPRYRVVSDWTGGFNVPLWDYNCYYNGGAYPMFGNQTLSQWQTSPNPNYIGAGYMTPDVNSIISNPLFVNLNSRNFRLQAGSPCHNSGYGGVTMGAYITGSEIIGPETISPPAPPTGLRITN